MLASPRPAKILLAALAVIAAVPALSRNSPTIPHLSCGSPPSGEFLLEWQSKPVHRYQLEKCSLLGSEQWIPVSTVFTGTGGIMSWSTPRTEFQGFYRLQVSLPPIGRIAFMGDSITEQGSPNLAYLQAYGYFCWARVFGGSRWELEQNGTTFRFATGGKRSDQISVLHMAQVTASQADACVLVYGTNDAYQMVLTATFVNNAVSDWSTLRAAGIEPVAATVLPMGSVGGQNGARQARVAEYNVALRAAATQHSVVLCDWTTVLEAVAGSNNGIGLDSYYGNNDNLHPNPLAASKLGRELNATLSAHFDFTSDTWGNTAWITPNVALAGTAGQAPDQWNFYPSAGATIHSRKFVSSPEGNWWEIEISPGTTPGNFNLITFANNLGGSPAGKTVETLAEIQVLSGGLSNLSLQTSTGANLASDLNDGALLGTQVLLADGIVVVRAPRVTLGAAVTQVIPSLYFGASQPNTIVRIRRCGVRVIE